MCSRLQLAAIGGLLLVALQSPRAETRSSTMQVRVTVVRACSIDTRGVGEVALTCTGVRGGSMVSAGSGSNARVVPVPTRQTTVVAMPALAQNGSGQTTARAGTPVRQIVTLNF